MKLIDCLSLIFFLSLSWIIEGHLTKKELNELLALDCDKPSVTLQVFSAKPNPVWTVNIKEVVIIKNIARNILKDYDKSISLINSTSRILGYQGFRISCSIDNEILIHGEVSLEKKLLDSGRSYLSPTIVEHVNQYIGQSISLTNLTSLTRINCDHVPIKGSDKVPVYNPQTDNGGCFIKKNSKNNCYAYATNIVTNTFPQPGRHSGKTLPSITCESLRTAAVLDGLVYNGTKYPMGHPKSGHFVALLIWPKLDYHWIRKDANGYWSHKPGAGSITNKDNIGSLITNPSKSNLSPWNLFCGYYVAQPSKINIS